MSNDKFFGLDVSGMMTGYGNMEAVLVQTFGNDKQRLSRGVFSRKIRNCHDRDASDGDITIHKQDSRCSIELRGAVGCKRAHDKQPPVDLIPFSLTTGAASPWLWSADARLRQLTHNVPLLLLVLRYGGMLRDVACMYWDSAESGALHDFVGEMLAMLITCGRVDIEHETHLELYESLGVGDGLMDLTSVHASLLFGILELDGATLVKLADRKVCVCVSNCVIDVEARDVMAKAARWALGDTSVNSSETVKYSAFRTAGRAMLRMFANGELKAEWPELAERLRRTRLVTDLDGWLEVVSPQPSVEVISVLRALANGESAQPDSTLRRELASLEFGYRPEDDTPTAPENP